MGLFRLVLGRGAAWGEGAGLTSGFEVELVDGDEEDERVDHLDVVHRVRA